MGRQGRDGGSWFPVQTSKHHSPEGHDSHPGTRPVLHQAGQESPFQTFSQRKERRSRYLEIARKTPNNVIICQPVSISESEIELLSFILSRLPTVAKQH